MERSKDEETAVQEHEERIEKLREQAEHVCSACDHASALGYTYCNHCLHGGCHEASATALAARDEIAEWLGHEGPKKAEPFSLNAPQLDDICEMAGRIVGSGMDCHMEYEDFQRYMAACVEYFRTQLSYAHDQEEEWAGDFYAGVDRGIAKARARFAEEDQMDPAGRTEWGCPDNRLICEKCSAATPKAWSAIDPTLCGPCYNRSWDDNGGDLC